MYDAIVIGSRIGGMTAAGLLADIAGKKVLVLERHTEPRGLTHALRRDERRGIRWPTLRFMHGMAPKQVEPSLDERALFSVS